MTNIGRVLRSLRQFAKLNQQQTAHELGISKSYLSEIESGKKDPSLDLLREFSNFFDVPLSLIMFLSEDQGTKRSGTLKERTLRFLEWVVDDPA